MSLENEACKYFIFFAKFEYALKKVGFHKSAHNNAAQPDWDRYILSLSNLSLENLKSISNEAKYLISNPPQKQIINSDDQLDMQDTNVDNLSAAIHACKRVRNNLFHGAKCNDDNQERNMKLLKGSMDILRKTLESDQNVKNKFSDTTI